MADESGSKNCTGRANMARSAAGTTTRKVRNFGKDPEVSPNCCDSSFVQSPNPQHFQQNPYLPANQLVERTDLSAPTVNAALADLERLGIVDEVTGRRRGRVFGYSPYLAILSEGTEPLANALSA